MKLVRYDAARRALEKASRIDEVKKIRDQAEALKAYAKQQRDSDMEAWVAAIKLRACRRIGEISRALEKASPKNGRGAGLPASGKTKHAALKDAGLSTSTVNRYEKLAEIPEAEFEEIVETARISNAPVTYDMAMKGGAHVSHNSGEREWFTPDWVVDIARQAMGGIDLDPASTEAANAVVRAAAFYDAAEDGLSKKWSGRIWLNPPYNNKDISAFLSKVEKSLLSESVEQACVLVNNATETEWFQAIAKHADAFCFFKGRIRFWHPDRESFTPLQGQALLYFGPRHKHFTKACKGRGLVFFTEKQ